MRGDFSSVWNKEKRQNFRGTLHQQGRVMTDIDWNAQTVFVNDWHEIAGRDIIGSGVAAIPADAAESFKITKAQIIDDEKIILNVNGGRVWADGLVIDLEKDVEREAEYLQPPIQSPAGEIPENPPNNPLLRDAVILEAWREEVNAFQLPEILIEPALGGVDTTERIGTGFRFKLYRMDDEETCDSIIDKLQDDFSKKGKLTVTLQPDTTIDSDCPVTADGGFTGFEHQLYRVEIALTNKTESYFKWSQFNGGLVGRGRFDTTNDAVDILSNKNAILYSGLTDFYLEAVKFDEDKGCWQVVYGAKVSLDNDGKLTLPANPADVFLDLSEIANNETAFFRLWNNIEAIDEFSSDTELQDGIFLNFEDDAEGKYTPQDYWTFQVRAGDVENNQIEMIAGIPTLIDKKMPEGVFYHRVPLAELTWTGEVIDDQNGDIEDCRRIFQPLTKLSTCCTYRVGDGISSHGDFKTIQEAINHLPKSGGEVCVMPGIYEENIVLEKTHNRNIKIKGCGKRSHIIAPTNKPAIHVAGGSDIKIESLAIQAHEEGVGILLEGDERSFIAEDEFNEGGDRRVGLLRNICLDNLNINAAEQSAIEMHVGQFVSITNCHIFIEDVETDRAAVYLAGDDVLFEENTIRVMNNRIVNQRVKSASLGVTDDPQIYIPAQNATGGLQLSGGCERVRVIDNLIIGGNGNGINLGSVDEETEETITVIHRPWYHRRDKCKPKPGYIDEEIIDENTRLIAGAPLRDIHIEHNRIFSMGKNGIGVDAYFVIEQSDLKNRYQGIRGEFIKIENLFIFDNRIEFCLNLPVEIVPGDLNSWMGFGGISLAWVENLVVRDNFITDNGTNYLEPVCGIFVLIGEGVEISRNRITNNGKLTAESATEESVKKGIRSGVFILFALPGTVTVNSIKTPDRTNFGRQFLFPDGVPALQMHENIIGVTMGRTLTTIAMGNVSVVGNQLLSQSAIPGFNILNFLSSNVLILNLGKSPGLQQTAGFKTIGADNDLKNANSQPDVMAFQQQPPPSTPNNPPSQSVNMGAYDNQSVVSGIRTQIMGGSTLFSNNQCRTINAGQDKRFGELCSILILSLADIGFHNNQCSLMALRFNHLIQALVVGMTVRFSDNFLEEIPRSVALSGVTYGILNTTTDNQSTHCLLGFGRLYLNRYNLTLLDAATASGDIRDPHGNTRCGNLDNILADITRKDDAPPVNQTEKKP